MGILDQIARGGKYSGLDIAKAGVQGRRDRMDADAYTQKMQMMAMEMQDYVEGRDRKKRLRASLKGTDFGDYESTTEASRKALETGDYETSLTFSKHALSQKGKKTDTFGKMQDIYIGGEKIGIGQYDNEGRVVNLKTTKQLEGDGGLEKPLKPSRASKGQKDEAVAYLKKSEAFGEVGPMDTGFSNKDYKELGSTIASRAQKIMVDAKQMRQSISYIEARDIAVQEVEEMGDSIYETDLFGMGKNLKKDEIRFKPGISKPLQDFLGVSTESQPTGVSNAEFAAEYSKLPSGAKYIDPKGVERIKK